MKKPKVVRVKPKLKLESSMSGYIIYLCDDLGNEIWTELFKDVKEATTIYNVLSEVLLSLRLNSFHIMRST